MKRKAHQALAHQVRRGSKARHQIAFAVSTRNGIECESQDIELCRDSAFDHAVRQSPIPVEAKLKHLRSGCHGADFLNSDRT